MVTKTEDLTYIKTILNSTMEEKFVNDSQYARQLFDDYLEVMAYISKNNLIVFKDDLYKLLKHNDEMIRDEAVALLGYSTRLFLPEFKDLAYEIFINDTSSTVKRTALSSWISYFTETKDPKVLTELYKILKDITNVVPVRAAAYSGIFYTIDMNHPAYDRINDYSALLDSSTNDEFNRIANWMAIDEIMKQYAPDVISKRE